MPNLSGGFKLCGFDSCNGQEVYKCQSIAFKTRNLHTYMEMEILAWISKVRTRSYCFQNRNLQTYENRNPCCEKCWFEFLEWWEEFLLAHHRSRWIGPTPPWGISKMTDPCKHMYEFNEFVLGHGQIYSW